MASSLSSSLAIPSAHAAARTPSPQLVQAANAFEASFLKELLKPLREDPLFGEGSGLGGDSLGSESGGGSVGGSADGSMDTISGISSDAFAQAIARNGGLGIARRVLAELSPVESKGGENVGFSNGLQCGGCGPASTGSAAVDEAGDSLRSAKEFNHGPAVRF
jgi:Rod binding domain-containing protein